MEQSGSVMGQSSRPALSDNQKAISEILETEKLSGSQLEQIHEISYTLAAAIDKLISSKIAVS